MDVYGIKLITIGELGSWCSKVGGTGRWTSVRKEVSMATQWAGVLTYLPTQYLPESWGGERGKASIQYIVANKVIMPYNKQAS